MHMGHLTDAERVAILDACRLGNPVPLEAYPALLAGGFVTEDRMPTDLAYVTLWNDHKWLHITLHARRRIAPPAQPTGYYEDI